MKVTVELSDYELKEIQSMTHEKKKGPAIKRLALEALQLKKRHVLSDRVMSGEWAVDLPEVAKLREDRRLR